MQSSSYKFFWQVRQAVQQCMQASTRLSACLPHLLPSAIFGFSAEFHRLFAILSTVAGHIYSQITHTHPSYPFNSMGCVMPHAPYSEFYGSDQACPLSSHLQTSPGLQVICTGTRCRQLLTSRPLQANLGHSEMRCACYHYKSFGRPFGPVHTAATLFLSTNGSCPPRLTPGDHLGTNHLGQTHVSHSVAMWT